MSTFSIKIGLSCYFSENRIRLEQATIKWNRILLKIFLLKSKDYCKMCGCSFIDTNETVEIHHILLKALSSKAKFIYLALLCRECYKDVTNVVKTRNF